MPNWNGPFCEADHRGSQSSHFEQHYTSQVALRQLCAKTHNNINDCKHMNLPGFHLLLHLFTLVIFPNFSDECEVTSNTDTPATSNDDFGGPTANSLKQLASELTQWRDMLPRELQWDEDDPASFPTPQQPTTMGSYGQSLDSTLLPRQRQSGSPLGPLFTSDLDSEPGQYPYAYDVQVALLRTRYYCAKYMAYRPFVYKALHFPEQMTQEDAEGVAECLRVST